LAVNERLARLVENSIMQQQPTHTWMDLKAHLLTKLLSILNPKVIGTLLNDHSVLRREIRLVAECLLDLENPLLNRLEREMTVDMVVADALGYGAIEAFCWDDSVLEVRVEGPQRILIRRGESFELTLIEFRSLEQLYLITGRLLGTPSKPIDPPQQRPRVRGAGELLADGAHPSQPAATAATALPTTPTASPASAHPAAAPAAARTAGLRPIRQDVLLCRH
jgi:hypothetical protein